MCQSNVILGVHEKVYVVEINGKMFLISVKSILSTDGILVEYSGLEVSWMTKACFPSVVNPMDAATIKISISLVIDKVILLSVEKHRPIALK